MFNQRFNLRCLRALTRQSRRAFTSETPIPTALYDRHVALGGKMVDFAGYSLPVQYRDGVMKSHHHTREAASLFDVSHMGQIIFTGEDRIKFLESIVPADLEILSNNQSQLSMLCNENAGILDDCVITKKADHIYMVVNGGCKHKDIAHMKKYLDEFKGDCKMEYLEYSRSLVALQGPKAAAVLEKLVPTVEFPKMNFMTTTEAELAGSVCWITRCGYTGEDGFEISIPSENVGQLWDLLLEHEEVLEAGLGARDSLRLEAGLCLYGHDLDENTTPVEANMTWIIGKRRREEGGFLGAEVMLQQIKDGPSRKRVGLKVLTGAPAREGAEIHKDGVKVGKVTSGTLSPCLKEKISMAFIDKPFFKLRTEVDVVVRGKSNKAKVCKMPFVKSNYFRAE